jgi:hypothetical protein
LYHKIGKQPPLAKKRDEKMIRRNFFLAKAQREDYNYLCLK